MMNLLNCCHRSFTHTHKWYFCYFDNNNPTTTTDIAERLSLVCCSLLLLVDWYTIKAWTAGIHNCCAGYCYSIQHKICIQPVCIHHMLQYGYRITTDLLMGVYSCKITFQLPNIKIDNIHQRNNK